MIIAKLLSCHANSFECGSTSLQQEGNFHLTIQKQSRKQITVNERFEALTVVKAWIAVFQIVKLCSLVSGCELFRGTNSLHFQG